MTLVTAYIEKYNTNGALISRKRGTILESSIIQNGERAADTARITFTVKDSCKQGDIVKYIQDLVDVEFLKGIWNFENSFRDEGGYDMDGLSSNVTSTAFEDGLGGRVARITTSSDPVTISSHSALSFSNQFDIYIYCKPNSTPTTKATIFSVYNGTTGIEIGITATTGKVYATFNGSTTITGSTTNLFDGNAHWIRVKRDSANLITVYVDGTSEGSTTLSGDFTNSASLLFGNDHSSSNLYNGILAQIRVYCGGLINSADDIIIRSSIRQPETMKFAGLVWQGDDQTSDKTIQANGFNKELINVKPNPATQGNIFGNGGADAPVASLILAFLIRIYLSKFKYFDTGILNHTMAKYSAIDTIFSNLSVLSLLFNANFHVNARQVIMTEPTNLDHTHLKFVNGKGYKITKTGDDDSALVNDLQAMVAPLKYGPSQYFSGNNVANQVFNLIVTGQYYGVYIQVDSGSGFTGGLFEGLDFKVDYNANTVTTLQPFASGTNNISIQVVKQDLSVNPIVSRTQDTTSIAQKGLHSKSITIQQLSSDFLSALFAVNFITKYKTVNKRITIEAPFLINSVRPNYLVRVVNNILGIDDHFVVRTITWNYPEFTTEILVGDYMFNAFDLYNRTVQKSNETHVATPRAYNAQLGADDSSGSPAVPSGTTMDGCLIATKCYVDGLFAVNGFNALLTRETMVENAFVFFDPPSHVWSPFQNVYIYNNDKLSETGSTCLSCFQQATPVDPTPGGGMSEAQTTTQNDDYIITFNSSGVYNIFNASVVSISLMPKSYWGNTADLYIDGVFNKSIAINGSGVFSTTFNYSTVGTHTADMRFGGLHVYVDFIV